MTELLVVLVVVQGALLGALIAHLNEGIPRWLWWSSALNAVAIAVGFLAVDQNVLAVAFAGVAGASFSFLSNPPGAAA